MASSEGGFIGVISLRSAEQVEQMSNAIRRLVHNSVALFPALLEELQHTRASSSASTSSSDYQRMFAPTSSAASSAKARVEQMCVELGSDAHTIWELAATFPPLCIEQPTSERALQIVTSLHESVRVCLVVSEVVGQRCCMVVVVVVGCE
jgi:hypothetical protein